MDARDAGEASDSRRPPSRVVMTPALVTARVSRRRRRRSRNARKAQGWGALVGSRRTPQCLSTDGRIGSVRRTKRAIASRESARRSGRRGTRTSSAADQSIGTIAFACRRDRGPRVLGDIALVPTCADPRRRWLSRPPQEKEATAASPAALPRQVRALRANERHASLAPRALSLVLLPPGELDGSGSQVMLGVRSPRTRRRWRQ